MTREAITFFDAMAKEYEALEPWYEHLYEMLHDVLRAELAPSACVARSRALDGGCGTGFQTAILDELGYAAHGLDLSPALLDGARTRLARVPLVQGDLQALPYRDESFDAATCCGSTLSYVDDARAALVEIARVLRSDGRLLVECEGRFSLDLAWAWLSGLLGDPWHYGVRPGDVWRAATARAGACRLSYPGYGVLRLFGMAEIVRLLRAAGLEPVRVWGFHSITNVLPSTLLHRARLGRRTAVAYRLLRRADRALASFGPVARCANSLVVLARKDARGAIDTGSPA